MNNYYHQLYVFTKLKVRTGRRLASLGAKDDARNIARFLRNACICEILKPHSCDFMDVSLLEFQLRELESECHPMSPGLSDLDKYSEILSRLDLIAAHVAKQSVDLRDSACPNCGAQISASARRSPLKVSLGFYRFCLGAGKTNQLRGATTTQGKQNESR